MVPALLDPRDRLQRIISNALDRTTYESSREEESGRLLVIEARKTNGQRVVLRLRGVKSSESSSEPSTGGLLRLKGVGPPGNFLQRLAGWPFHKPFQAEYRVTIQAGTARLDVVCQDAEWWQEPGTTGGQ